MTTKSMQHHCRHRNPQCKFDIAEVMRLCWNPIQHCQPHFEIQVGIVTSILISNLAVRGLYCNLLNFASGFTQRWKSQIEFWSLEKPHSQMTDSLCLLISPIAIHRGQRLMRDIWRESISGPDCIVAIEFILSFQKKMPNSLKLWHHCVKISIATVFCH